MRKTILVLVILIFCFIISFSYAYSTYHSNIKKVENFNQEFEKYQGKEIAGSEMATVINKAVDNNRKYSIQTDNKANYIEDEEYSLKIEVYITENKKTYSMETIYKLGVEQFVNNFSTEKFTCTKIEYHQKTKRVCYLLFEQKLEQ